MQRARRTALLVVAALVAAAPAQAATVTASLSHDVGTPSAPAPIGAVIGVAPDAPGTAGNQPLALEVSPELVLGRGSDAPACSAEAMLASVSNCPEPPVGGGSLELAAPAGPVTVQLAAYGAEGGLGLNVLATSQAPAPERSVIPVTVGPDRSHLAFDWRELIARTAQAAGGAVGVTDLDLRLFTRGAWITTIGCTGAWQVAATLTAESGRAEVPCTPSGDGGGDGLCPVPAQPGVDCVPGRGRRLDEAQEGKVSHKGWPALTGILAIADHAGRTLLGTALSDELLGGHGNDDLQGGASSDVLWGDPHKRGNTRRQRDRLSGGDGDDFLYASHGRNVVDGGDGRDDIWAYFVHGSSRISAGAGNDEVWEHSGRGTIDCGPGRDIVHTRLGHHYALKGCEVVRHYCAFGSDGHGGCRTPTGTSRGPRRAPRRGVAR